MRTDKRQWIPAWLRSPARFFRRHIVLNGLFLWLVAKLLVTVDYSEK